MNIQSHSSTIKINLPSGILHNAKNEADRIGISVQDFIRMLMGSYFANSPTLLSKAKREIAEGEYTTIENSKDLDNYLKKLNS